MRTEFGFTLIELMLVVFIALIVGAFAMVNAVSAARSIRLSEATTDYSNLLQKARIQAVTSDTFYSVLTDTSKTPDTAFVNVNGATYAKGDPVIAFPRDVKPMPFASGPNLSNLESNPQFLPANNQNTVQTTIPPTFGPRGLPCKPTGVGANTTCPSLLTPTSYITFFQNSVSQKWAAVTVNPSGRIRRWSYDGSTWSPVN
jgi:prepilin-type N-terminal cleavage/methylation domain-containing protein